MKFFEKLNFDFIGKKYIFYTISLAMMGVSIVSLVTKGPILSIEFTGGTVLQIGFKELPPIDKVRAALDEEGWKGFGLQTQPANNSIIVRVKQGDKSKEDIAQQVIATLKNKFPNQVNDIPERVEFVGPVIGKKFKQDALISIVGSLLLIIVYVAFRFKNWIWGFAGVMALMHDVFIAFGFMVLLQKEITLNIISALLTLAGYSINDTIVIFDRVRENLRTARKESPKEIMNRSINETMARTINTSMTAFLAALSLCLWGGDVIHDFSLCLAFGIVIGSYSTVGIASALVHQIQYGNK